MGDSGIGASCAWDRYRDPSLLVVPRSRDTQVRIIPTPKRYAAGTMHGNYTVIGESSSVYSITSRHGTVTWHRSLDVKCLTCGAVMSVQQDTLYRSSRSRRKGCAQCAWGAGARKHKSLFGGCPQCSDLPWRRPENHPCRCGKHYEPEQFMIEVCRGQSSIAACQNGIGVAYI